MSAAAAAAAGDLLRPPLLPAEWPGVVCTAMRDIVSLRQRSTIDSVS